MTSDNQLTSVSDRQTRCRSDESKSFACPSGLRLGGVEIRRRRRRLRCQQSAYQHHASKYVVQDDRISTEQHDYCVILGTCCTCENGFINRPFNAVVDLCIFDVCSKILCT